MREIQHLTRNKRILQLVLSVFISVSLSAQSIHLKWIGEKPALKTGVSWGVPFEKGIVKKLQSFTLFADKSEIPVQTWTLACWADGSVKWLGLAAVTDSQNDFQLSFTSKAKKLKV
ncbi:MAG: hypothetical protein Q7U47_13455 [Paludibacter sp.]|nr:hypothetical protein [Paludibacter sp.]